MNKEITDEMCCAEAAGETMTDLTLEALAEIHALVADVFSVKVEHITEAPRHCRVGLRGDCWSGQCEIVAAVEKMAVYRQSVLIQAAKSQAFYIGYCAACKAETTYFTDVEMVAGMQAHIAACASRPEQRLADKDELIWRLVVRLEEIANPGEANEGMWDLMWIARRALTDPALAPWRKG